MIEIQALKKEKTAISQKMLKKVIKEICTQENKKEGEIFILFCSDNYLLEINKKYLQHDYFTDIITFDYNENDTIHGDLLISLDRVNENTKIYNLNYNHELFRVIIHGVLHLCGYKDKSRLEKITMRFKENYYLNKFVSRETLISVR